MPAGFSFGATIKYLIATALLAACAWASAGPAPWYKWRSKIDGTLSCAQSTLGFGWELASGPYKDSRCEKPALVK
ncbi:hypothetical protein [Janthinobacterium lividum]|uniref:hypothetical protein n=1 Tax=Janthinobacterium lividum TaxID=29581 RepID=UPI000873B774|nr:hypothetical protein [Janthinobacterium lividum]MCC7716618.1 hypothetical protein [Janthinobacterium lividum]OEZ63459.1 hypothetical protein JANLI_08560 [Janthinobacterium lividum]WQE30912.1 hypothetical protein U0004_11070 [Janthinobacterium lividum]STQ96434.1 Uncharacterised protein [Janthinobacterium lividum]